MQSFFSFHPVNVEKRYSPALEQIHLLDKKSTIARVKLSKIKKDKPEEEEEGSALTDILSTEGSSDDKDDDIETDKDAMGESIDAPKDHDSEKKKKDDEKKDDKKEKEKTNDEQAKKDAKSKRGIFAIK